MSSSTNVQLCSKSIKIEDTDSSSGIWLYYDKNNETIKTTHVNSDTNYIGEFLSNPMSPTEIFVGQAYNNTLSFSFDFNLGSNTNVSSQRNGNLTTNISGNTINLVYTGLYTTDVFTFETYSANNLKKKTFIRNISLSTTDNLPSNIVGNPTINTLNHKYSNLVVVFQNPVDSGSVSTQSSQSIIENVSFVDGNIKFDYTSPTSDNTDKIIFTNVRTTATQVVNNYSQSLPDFTLLEQPVFQSWTYTPASQSFSYTGPEILEAIFSKDIQSCSSISASSGTPPSIIPQSIIGNKIKFEWSSLNTGNVTFTFNDLVATDGTIDANIDLLVNTGAIVLFEPASILGWVGSQPIDANTSYNLSVNFNKTLSNARTPVISTSDDSVPSNISISGSQINFSITTSSNPGSVVYTFNNVLGADGSIKNGATLSSGPKITSVQVESDLSGNYLTTDKIVKTRNQKVLFFLSKAINGNISFVANDKCTFSNISMINPTTAQVSITPVDNGVGDLFLNVQTNLMIGTDNSQNSDSYTFNMVYPQTIVELYESVNKNSAKTNFDVGTSVDLSLEVSKPIDSDLSNTTITASKSATITSISQSEILGKYYYNFNFTPNTAGINESIYVNNAKDIDLFLYTLYKTGLTFSEVIPFTTTSLLSWYDFQETNVTLSGGYIQQVNDKHGSYNLTSSLPDATIETSLSSSGLPYYLGDNVNYNSSKALASFSDSNSYNTITYFVAIRPTNSNTYNMAVAFAQVDGTGRLFYSGNNIYGNAQSGGGPPGHSIDTSRWYVVSLEITNGGLNLRSKVWDHPSDTTYHSGVGSNTYPMKFFGLGKQSAIGEVVIYNNTLSDSEAGQVASYLANKWN